MASILEVRQSTVRGFIRQYSKKFIPVDIIHVCMLFYALYDRFDSKCISSKMELNEETQSVMKIGDNKPVSAYLENITQSGLNKWKFKIVRRTGSMIIGVWRVTYNNDPMVDTCFTLGGNRGYGYSVNTAKITDVEYGWPTASRYGVKCRSGDVVEMVLNFYDLSLSFKVNGTDYGEAHRIKPDKYRAAVFMHQIGDEIQILE